MSGLALHGGADQTQDRITPIVRPSWAGLNKSDGTQAATISQTGFRCTAPIDAVVGAQQHQISFAPKLAGDHDVGRHASGSRLLGAFLGVKSRDHVHKGAN